MEPGKGQLGLGLHPGGAQHPGLGRRGRIGRRVRQHRLASARLTTEQQCRVIGRPIKECADQRALTATSEQNRRFFKSFQRGQPISEAGPPSMRVRRPHQQRDTLGYQTDSLGREPTGHEPYGLRRGPRSSHRSSSTRQIRGRSRAASDSSPGRPGLPASRGRMAFRQIQVTGHSPCRPAVVLGRVLAPRVRAQYPSPASAPSSGSVPGRDRRSGSGRRCGRVCGKPRDGAAAAADPEASVAPAAGRVRMGVRKSPAVRLGSGIGTSERFAGSRRAVLSFESR